MKAFDEVHLLTSSPKKIVVGHQQTKYFYLVLLHHSVLFFCFINSNRSHLLLSSFFYILKLTGHVLEPGNYKCFTSSQSLSAHCPCPQAEVIVINSDYARLRSSGNCSKFGYCTKGVGHIRLKGLRRALVSPSGLQSLCRVRDWEIGCKADSVVLSLVQHGQNSGSGFTYFVSLIQLADSCILCSDLLQLLL